MCIRCEGNDRELNESTNCHKFVEHANCISVLKRISRIITIYARLLYYIILHGRASYTGKYLLPFPQSVGNGNCADVRAPSNRQVFRAISQYIMKVESYLKLHVLFNDVFGVYSRSFTSETVL